MSGYSWIFGTTTDSGDSSHILRNVTCNWNIWIAVKSFDGDRRLYVLCDVSQPYTPSSAVPRSEWRGFLPSDVSTDSKVRLDHLHWCRPVAVWAYSHRCVGICCRRSQVVMWEGTFRQRWEQDDRRFEFVFAARFSLEWNGRDCAACRRSVSWLSKGSNELVTEWNERRTPYRGCSNLKWINLPTPFSPSRGSVLTTSFTM